jgi:ATP-dependent exoDNAse (exonuclease V) beta subunit
MVQRNALENDQKRVVLKILYYQFKFQKNYPRIETSKTFLDFNDLLKYFVKILYKE